MESTTRELSFEALSATMILCRGRNTSPAVHIRLSGIPLKKERMQIMVDLAEHAMKGPLFVPAWYENHLYLHPDGEVIGDIATYLQVIAHIGLGENIIDIPFENFHDHPGHHDTEDVLLVHPEVYREQ